MIIPEPNVSRRVCPSPPLLVDHVVVLACVAFVTPPRVTVTPGGGEGRFGWAETGQAAEVRHRGWGELARGHTKDPRAIGCGSRSALVSRVKRRSRLREKHVGNVS